MHGCNTDLLLEMFGGSKVCPLTRVLGRRQRALRSALRGILTILRLYTRHGFAIAWMTQVTSILALGSLL